MSYFKLRDIDQTTLSDIPANTLLEDGGISFIPLSSNYAFHEFNGRGFVLEEQRAGLIRLYNTGIASISNLFLLTEDGRELLTTGDVQSRFDQYSGQPIIVDRIR